MNLVVDNLLITRLIVAAFVIVKTHQNFED